MGEQPRRDLGAGVWAHVAGDSGPGVVVLQEYWGLVEQITEFADDLASHGFVVVVPDLYRGESTDDRGRAAELMRSLEPEDALEMVDHTIRWLRGEHRPVAVLGFCMGGGLALATAAERGEEVDSCVCFYGFVPWPELDPDWRKVRVPIQLHFAGRDTFAAPSAGERIAQEVCEGGGQAEFHLYPSAEHAFMDDTRPASHDAEAAATAMARTLQFLTETLSRDRSGDAT